MQKCLRCNLTFSLNDRIRCLYCDTILVHSDEDEEESGSSGFFENAAGDVLLKEIVRYRYIAGPDYKYHVISSYFKARSLPFIYSVCRHEMLMDEKFSRFWVQPLGIGYFISFIPWLIVNFFDSIFVHLAYRRFCPECECKYALVSGATDKHNPESCEYNKEYLRVIFSILNGHILKNEEKLKKESLKKIMAGQKSAYKDLCSAKRRYQNAIDVACVWLSCSVLVSGIVWLSYPITIFVINHLD